MESQTIFVKGEEIGFRILPQFGKVNAEIYRKAKMFKDGDFELRLLSKEFGSMFRSPNEQDYINARKWVDLQMKSIQNSNK